MEQCGRETLLPEERMKAAQRVAAQARRGRPQLDQPQRTSGENEHFVADFLAASRLHFIGSWKERYFALLDTLPPPPPLPPPPIGGDRTLIHIGPQHNSNLRQARPMLAHAIGPATRHGLLLCLGGYAEPS